MPASCGSDDDDITPNPNPSPITNEVGIIIDANGIKHRVTSFGNIKYLYDEKGKLIKIQRHDKEIDLSNSKLEVNQQQIDDYEESIASTSVSTNDQGLISGITTTFEWKEEKEGFSEKGTANGVFEYDSNGQLISCCAQEQSIYIEDGESGRYSYEVDVMLTWNDRKLTKIRANMTEVEDGFRDSETEEMTFEYGTQPNFTRQWLQEMGFALFEWGLDENLDILESLAPLGLLGHGPAVLPISCSYDYDGKTKTRNLSYTMNENGTIHSDNGTIYTYDDATRAAILTPFAQPEKTRHRSLRMRSRRMSK